MTVQVEFDDSQEEMRMEAREAKQRKPKRRETKIQIPEAKLKVGAKACADVLRTMITMIKNYTVIGEHGLTEREVAFYFPKVCHYSLKTYGNRLRDLCNPKLFNPILAKRHTVHSERHFYPVGLDEQGLIDHSKCMEKCKK